MTGSRSLDILPGAGMINTESCSRRRRSPPTFSEGRRMPLVRHVIPVLVGSLLCAVPLRAQDSTGTITGQVIDSTSRQPLIGVNVSIVGTSLRTVTRNDGGFVLAAVSAGPHRLRAARIGDLPQEQDVTVTAGGAASREVGLPQ